MNTTLNIPELSDCTESINCLVSHGIADQSTRAQRELLIDELLKFDDVVTWLTFQLIHTSPNAAETLRKELEYFKAKGLL